MRLEILYERFSVPFHPNVLPAHPTAEFIHDFSLALGRRGWTVVVYVHDTCQQPLKKENVLFLDRMLYENENNKKHRERVLCINCQPTSFEPQAKYYILVDPFIPTNAFNFDETKFENLILVTELQTKLLTNVPPQKVKVIERVSNENVIGNVLPKDKANILLYTGAHDSNLIKLLGIWWKINKLTDYELIVTGPPSFISSFDVTGVTYYQNPSNSELNQFFRQAKFWFNNEGNDVIEKININKAISANTIPLYENSIHHSDILSELGIKIENDIQKNLIEILNGHKVLYRHFEKEKANYTSQFWYMVDAFEDLLYAKVKTKNIEV